MCPASCTTEGSTYSRSSSPRPAPAWSRSPMPSPLSSTSLGFDSVSTTAQEAANPQRDMPRGIIGSLIICTILYCLGALVLTGVVNYKQLHVHDPVAVATDAMGKPWLSFYVKIGAIAG